MAGHSKWSQIKRKKGLKDKQKGAIFAKHSRIITLAVTEGGGISDPSLNLKLRLAIEQAKSDNMPKATIERAIQNAVSAKKTNLKRLYYDAFGPFGSMLFIEALSDNESRTVSDVKSVLRRYNAKFAASGSVGHLFRACGIVVIASGDVSENTVLQFAERLDASDIQRIGEGYEIIIPFNELGRVGEQMGSLEIISQESTFLPASSRTLPKEEEQAVLAILDALEELDDVQRVYTDIVFS